jgi:precorrin-2 dehydrogenase/sirohydrochlorin ferrochelatase
LSPRRKDRRSPLAASHEERSRSRNSAKSDEAGGAAMPYYPVMLHVQGKRCVVVGGGEVALRKVTALMEHDAHVEIISPELCSELSQLAAAGAIKATLRDYESGDLQGAFVAVAATADGTTNRQVAEEAMKRGVLVNVVDTPELCSFIIPSCLRRGAVTIAVSTGGKSPALARKIRTELEPSFGHEYGPLASMVEEVRSELRQKGITIPGEAWQRALDLEPLLEMLRRGQRDEAKRRLQDSLGRYE